MSRVRPASRAGSASSSALIARSRRPACRPVCGAVPGGSPTGRLPGRAARLSKHGLRAGARRSWSRGFERRDRRVPDPAVPDGVARARLRRCPAPQMRRSPTAVAGTLCSSGVACQGAGCRSPGTRSRAAGSLRVSVAAFGSGRGRPMRRCVAHRCQPRRNGHVSRARVGELLGDPFGHRRDLISPRTDRRGQPGREQGCEPGDVPEHWWTFGQRHSLLSSGPRQACNPPNAAINYPWWSSKVLIRFRCRGRDGRRASSAFSIAEPSWGRRGCARRVR